VEFARIGNSFVPVQPIFGVSSSLLFYAIFVLLCFSQEPGSNAEIKERVNKKWPIAEIENVKMMAKVNVKMGDSQHFVYSYLSKRAGKTGNLDWNFAKVFQCMNMFTSETFLCIFSSLSQRMVRPYNTFHRQILPKI
jgi:hypothetical protein